MEQEECPHMTQSYEEVYTEWRAFQAKRTGLATRKEELEGIIKTAQVDLATVMREQALLENKTNGMVEKLAQATMAMANANPCTGATSAPRAQLPPLLLRRVQ